MGKRFHEMTQLDRIEKYSLLAAKDVLTVEEASLIIGLSPSTIYKMTATRQIPFYKPNGKLVFFNKHELEEWAMQNRVAAASEIEDKAADYNLRNS